MARKYLYTLDEDFVHRQKGKSFPACDLPWIKIFADPDDPEYFFIVITRGYAWDGCTGVPNGPRNKWASLIHDALYQFCEKISKQSGWSVRRVLTWADKVFRDRMIADKEKPMIIWTYYAGVRILGHAYHSGARFFRKLFGIEMET